jgi:hypothetical protein
MMIIDSPEHLYMKIHFRIDADCVKEFPRELCLKAPYTLTGKLTRKIEVASPPEINAAKCKRIIHRQDKIPKPCDALLAAECLLYRLSKHDTGIFYRMVRIDLQISHCLQRKIKKTMLCKAFQHMVKKADSGFNVTFKIKLPVPESI